ncbi:MAG: ribonuclease Z [Bacteroidetes bacterium 47-18]|nr:MAG: ribonuclease Z [Bacteroidetes bacterium 47-18]
MITITILGNNSALPAHGRLPSSQIVAIRDQHFMVDCGEGTQMQLQKLGMGWGKIEHIFISHLHGDHYFGLIGLVTSMNLLNRALPLNIYGPPELEQILQIQLSIGGGTLNYPLFFHPVANAGEHRILLDTPYYSVSCFPVMHRIPCHGFKFTAKSTGRKIIPEACREYGIPRYFYARLKEGMDYIRKDGEVIRNEWVTAAPQPEPTYAYCADTVFTDSFIPYIQGCHTIYHETTYLKKDEDKAMLRFHSTTHQAAATACSAGAARLLIGHYSSRYEHISEFEAEAKEIFSNTIATQSGDVFTIRYEDVAPPQGI